MKEQSCKKPENFYESAKKDQIMDQKSNLKFQMQM